MRGIGSLSQESMVCSGCFEWDQLARQGTTPFVEPEVVSGAAFAKGCGGCNDWHSWFDTAEGTEVSFSQFTDGERVYSDKRMQIEKDYLAALAKVEEFRLEGEMLGAMRTWSRRSRGCAATASSPTG